MNGQGDHRYLQWSSSKLWTVIEYNGALNGTADQAKFVHGTGKDTGKHKMEYATIRYAGNREGAAGFLRATLAPLGINSEHLQVHGVRRYNDPPTGKSWGGAGSHIVIGANADVKVGFRSFVHAGSNSLVVAENECYMVVGDDSKGFAEHYSSVFGGHKCYCRCGFQGVVSIGNDGWALGFDKSDLYTGNNCQVKLKNYGVVVAKDDCTIEVGNYCEVTAGNNARVTAGRECIVQAGPGSFVSGQSGTVIRLEDSNGDKIVGEVRHLSLRRGVSYKFGPNKTFVEA